MLVRYYTSETELNTLTVKITVQSYLIWRQALNASRAPVSASLVPRERDHVHFIRRRRVARFFRSLWPKCW